MEKLEKYIELKEAVETFLKKRNKLKKRKDLYEPIKISLLDYLCILNIVIYGEREIFPEELKKEIQENTKKKEMEEKIKKYKRRISTSDKKELEKIKNEIQNDDKLINELSSCIKDRENAFSTKSDDEPDKEWEPKF